jgi:hypothetical protein
MAVYVYEAMNRQGNIVAGDVRLWMKLEPSPV